MPVLMLLLLSGCAVQLPPSEQLGTQLPQLLNDIDGAYVIVTKPEPTGGSFVDQNVGLDGRAPLLIGGQKALVWKVSPGRHFVNYIMWVAQASDEFDIDRGERVVFEVDGGGGLKRISFLAMRDTILQYVRLQSYQDESNFPPVLPPRSERARPQR